MERKIRYYSSARDRLLNRFRNGDRIDTEYMEIDLRRKIKIIKDELTSDFVKRNARSRLSVIGIRKARRGSYDFTLEENLILKFFSLFGLERDEMLEAVKFGMKVEWMADYLGKNSEVDELLKI